MMLVTFQLFHQPKLSSTYVTNIDVDQEFHSQIFISF